MTIPAHAELIHAFADGKTLQWQSRDTGQWLEYSNYHCPDFADGEWRIKPEPKMTRYLAYEETSGWVVLKREGTTGPNSEHYRRIPALDKEVTEKS